MVSNPGNATILVVEDEQIVALDLQERLQLLGYVVPITVATGHDAIEHALQQRPDLILMDIKLQGEIDGIEAAARIHAKLDVPIIYLTAFGDDTTVDRAEATEPYAYVLKPFKEQEIKIAIEMALFRHRTMRKLAESEAWLAATIESVGDALIAVDPNERIQLMNDEAETLTGWLRHEAIGRDISEVVCLEPEDTREVAGSAKFCSTWLEDRAGCCHYVELARKPIRAPNGQSYGAVLALRDVTERHRRQDTQRTMVEAGAALASTLDMDSALAAVTRLIIPAIAEGYTLHLVDESEAMEKLGVAAVEHRDPAVREMLQRGVGPLEADKSSLLIPLVQEVARTGTTRWLEEVEGPSVARAFGASDDAAFAGLSFHSLMSVPLAARGRTFGALTFLSMSIGRPNDALAITLAEDLGRRIAAALDNAVLYGEAQRAIRVRDEMMAIVSHDLRNPLTTVLANTELLMRSSNGSAKEKAIPIAQGIRRAALRMQRLIGDLLDVARIDKNLLALDLDFCTVGELVEEALDAFYPCQLGTTTHTLVRSISCPEALVRCDRDRIAQVFSNLLSNARAWIEPGGTITISAEKRDGEILFAVSDTGPGIRETEIPQLFKQFFRGTGAGYSGAGLGLYISKGIVDAHGGKISVDSTLSKGSTFYFTLPASAAQRAAS